MTETALAAARPRRRRLQVVAIVAAHNDTADRLTNGTGRIRDFALADPQKLDAGYRFTPDGGATYPYRGQGIHIPTLDEVFKTFPQARATSRSRRATSPSPSPWRT